MAEKKTTTKKADTKTVVAKSAVAKVASTESKKIKFSPEVGAAELLKQYNEHIEKLAEHRMMLVAGQLAQTHVLRQIRRNIARIKQAMAMIV